MPKTSYEVLEGDKLTYSQTSVILDLIIRSIDTDYPNLSLAPWHQFVSEAAKTLGDPNAGVGTSLLRGGQSFARPLNILAKRNGKAIAHLPIADNVSSRYPTVVGALERRAKLSLDHESLIGRRYLWLGYAAMSSEVREQIATSPDDMNPLDYIIAIAVRTRDSRQPVVAYPWDEETAWRTELTSLGFVNQEGQDDIILPFGETGPSIHQERWLAASPSLLQAEKYLPFRAAS